MQEVKRSIITTTDGSRTVEIPELHVTYHSRYGALQESMHVFIKAGLRYVLHRDTPPSPLRIFEMGLGTGLNALLTIIEAEKEKLPINYTAVEAYPLQQEEWQGLNYGEDEEQKGWLLTLHEGVWNEDTTISEHFTFRKEHKQLTDFTASHSFHLIYYDAFAPSAQPELWTKEVFEKLYGMLHPGGILVTYCSKSIVRRAMQAAGFSVQKIPGPKWKREMLRAVKE
jgi:tRNA U34 5-methylaminomethyl-2-thiouridine-forming methyltransferase MnmC